MSEQENTFIRGFGFAEITCLGCSRPMPQTYVEPGWAWFCGYPWGSGWICFACRTLHPTHWPNERRAAQ